MEANVKKHPVLNAVLSVLNVSLEIVLALIAMGVIIGFYELLKY